ncbi:MurR/RpiR family transcriptional regulator [Siculibacillus lacustris]|uniref:MurR/RpiR family transcriptional regulator n=1 Tax=Siculibacillus lacustris TaxID=1549641 RepID=A0A4Q9VML2_9HYPH|nr:MurR/RpiR family transcriptional regulator [Siculibacillus lacustris]TBW36810.1 MurR/RpiR family transcriptional regulator [Siculibacillus lacustris]
MKTVRERLAASLDDATPAGRSVAAYMLANLGELPFETAASLAAKIGVGELTIGRFCRSIGYKHFKELKADLKADVGDSPWLVGDRLREFQERARLGSDQLATGLELEIGALVRIYEIAQTPEFRGFVRDLARFPRVFCAGFQTERGAAAILAHQLQYLRDEVRLVDMTAGNFVDVLLTDPASVLLVILDTRRYSRHSRLLAEEARARGIRVVLLTDTFCDWARGVVDEVFEVPTQLGHFWDSLGPLVSLIQLAVNGVFAELGTDVEHRLDRMFACYSRFTGYSGSSKDT